MSNYQVTKLLEYGGDQFLPGSSIQMSEDDAEKYTGRLKKLASLPKSADASLIKYRVKKGQVVSYDGTTYYERQEFFMPANFIPPLSILARLERLS